jgi:hypothetical protein
MTVLRQPSPAGSRSGKTEIPNDPVHVMHALRIGPDNAFSKPASSEHGVDLPLVTVFPTVAESPTAVEIMRCAAWAGIARLTRRLTGDSVRRYVAS